MAHYWTGSGLWLAEQGFRKIRGYNHLPELFEKLREKYSADKKSREEGDRQRRPGRVSERQGSGMKRKLEAINKRLTKTNNYTMDVYKLFACCFNKKWDIRISGRFNANSAMSAFMSVSVYFIRIVCHRMRGRAGYLMVLLFLIFHTPLYGEMDATGSGLRTEPGIDETIRVHGVYRVKSSLFKDMTEYRFDLDANSREWHIKSEIIRFPKSITDDGNSLQQEKIMPYKSITCGKFNDIYYTAYEINHKYDQKWDIIYTAKKIADYETEREELNPLAQVFNKQQLNQEEVEENHRIMNQQTGEFKKYHIQKLTGLVEEFTGGDRKKVTMWLSCRQGTQA